MTLTKFPNDLLAYQFDELLKEYGVFHGIFTRNGGVSLPPYSSLNLGGSIGDKPSDVTENRRRIFSAIDRPVESMFDVWQVHGSNVVCTESPRDMKQGHIKADAIFTSNSEVTLLMRFADCVPILIVDPVRKVVGIIHAGWKGTVEKIALIAIQTIIQEYSCNPEDIIAGIGPSIGPEHYEVGSEVQDAVRKAFVPNYDLFINKQNGKVRFDLWAANEYLIRLAGVKNVLRANICTACNTTNWFSHRAEGGKTGRFAAVIGIIKGDN